MDNNISILIIDDNPWSCETLSDILEEEGYRVVTVESGLRGTEEIEKRFFNAVLLDIILPDIDGLEVLKSIKKINPDICVVIITGYATLQNAIGALNEGADAYINKPLNIDEVKLIIKRGVERQILIFEKKRLEQRIRETNEYLLSILDNSADMIFTTDLKGRIVEFNKGAEQILGLPKEKVIGRSMEEFFINSGEGLRLLDIVTKEGSISNYETGFKRKDGGIIDISLTLSLLKNDSRERIGTVGIGRDITERKKIEQQLLQSEKLAGIGIIASGIAHEINNPLHGIMGTAEAILMEKDLVLVNQYARDIIKYSEESAEIIKNLTGYARSARKGEHGVVDINEKLTDAIKVARHTTRFEDVEITTDLQDLPPIKANSGEIQQVFVNLINNAIQAMEGNGKLSISTKTDRDTIEINLTDTGPGIPKEYIHRIFDPFFTTKEIGKGTGLGLNIVYRIVTKYRGTIDVESKVGKGATFKVRFPLET